MEKAADEELQGFLKNGPTAAELQLAKTQILGRYARIVERIGGFGGKSDLLARCQAFRGNPDCYKDYLKWVKAATPATVKKAADEWLSDGDYVLECIRIPPRSRPTPNSIGPRSRQRAIPCRSSFLRCRKRLSATG